MLAEQPEIDILVVAIGGGGLIAGMATAAQGAASRPARRRGPDRALPGGVERDPRRRPRSRQATIAEGIGVKSPGALTLPVIRALVDDVVLVSEDDIEQAILMLLEIEKTVVEGAGAVGLAALMKEPARFAGKNVGLVLCGGNIEPLVLAEIIERGMVKSGRLVRLRVDIRDVPGALADVAALLARLGANIDEVQHQRAFTSLSVERVADRGRRADARRGSRRRRSSRRSRRGLRRQARRLMNGRRPSFAARSVASTATARAEPSPRVGFAARPREPLHGRPRPPRRIVAHEEAGAVGAGAGDGRGRATSGAHRARLPGADRGDRPHGPRLRSVIALNPDALAIASARRRAQGRPPARPAARRAGAGQGQHRDRRPHEHVGRSLALAGVRAPRDAHIVKRLRDAGAVILGKNNLSEWANIRSTRSVSGWSARGGLTRNPYALDRSTSGSSSGTAAAIAASLAPLGVGTETDGSIVSPASICGLVGLKPTVGRLSRDGIVPISPTRTRRADDAQRGRRALLYAAMAGRDGADAATSAAPGRVGRRRSPARDALRGARLGVARAYFTGFDELDALIEQAIVVMKRAGAEIVDPVDLPCRRTRDAELRVLLYEFKAGPAALPRDVRAGREGEDARRRDRLQPRPSRARDALVRPGAVREGRGATAASTARSTWSRWPSAGRARATTAWTASSRQTASTPWSRRPAARPG